MTTKETTPAAGSLAADEHAGFSGDEQPTTFGGAARGYVDRLRGGDMGALPAILGLVVLIAVFSALQPDDFPTPSNIAALTVQAGAICVLAMGLVPVLLLGDIDLSAGVAGGTGAAVIALLIADHDQPWPVAVLGGLVVGAVIGLAIGFLVAKIGVPSFVVTLAFFLALQGVTLKLIGNGASVPLRDETLLKIANGNLPVVAGWVLAVIAVLLFAGLSLNSLRVKAARGLQRPPMSLVVVKIVLLGVVVLGATYILNRNRALNPELAVLQGIPYVVPLVAVILLVLTFLFSRTTYGRHVYAVGGNKEAARRAGINVDRIRISVFMIASSLAAISGLITASRLNGVAPDAGGGNTLLYAVGAAVIGGTSLFGGKGFARDAIIGGLVIATIDNGLGLLGQEAYVKFIVTGGVLLIAASIDALSRRRRSSTGT